MTYKKYTYKQSPNIVEAELDSEYCLFSSESASYYSLNKTSSRIWSYLKENIQFDQILKQLLDEFSVNPEICEKDLKDFLDNGVSLGFVVKNEII